MKVDVEKLLTELEDSLKVVSGIWLDSSFLLGEINGKQIQIKVTRDAEDFMDIPACGLIITKDQ